MALDTDSYEMHNQFLEALLASLELDGIALTSHRVR